MDLSWLGESIAGLPPELRFFAIIAICIAVYKYVDVKHLQPKNGNGHKALRDKVGDLELHLTNHLTTEVAQLKQSVEAQTIAVNAMTSSVQELSKEVRNLVEQTNRTVNTMNVMLNKMDNMRDMVVEVKGKV